MTTMVRTGLKTFLDTQDGMQVIAEADNGDAAIRLAKELVPQVIVMDITMAGLDGMEATRQIKAARPECKVLALTVQCRRAVFLPNACCRREG
jgi:DNA-binding NarL/FixJ family response regulator